MNITNGKDVIKWRPVYEKQHPPYADGKTYPEFILGFNRIRLLDENLDGEPEEQGGYSLRTKWRDDKWQLGVTNHTRTLGSGDVASLGDPSESCDEAVDQQKKGANPLYGRV